MTPEQPKSLRDMTEADFNEALGVKPAAPEPSEREAFEAWWHQHNLHMGQVTAFDVWDAWQARAALSVHQVGAPEPAVVEPTRAALAELVALKDMREAAQAGKGIDPECNDYLAEYNRRRTPAWANARAALAAVTGSNLMEKQEPGSGSESSGGLSADMPKRATE